MIWLAIAFVGGGVVMASILLAILDYIGDLQHLIRHLGSRIALLETTQAALVALLLKDDDQ